MAFTSFTVRQFYNMPDAGEIGTFTAPAGVFVVTGSISRLLVNNTRTNLAADVMNITISESPFTYVANSGTSQGWWAGTFTNEGTGFGSPLIGTIVGGVDGVYNNSTPPPIAISSSISIWGFETTEGAEGGDQENLDAAFIALAGNILGTTYANTGSAKTALRNAGFYYQYPRGFDGQSPNTGAGSDV
jgi:hypothetical protein